MADETLQLEPFVQMPGVRELTGRLLVHPASYLYDNTPQAQQDLDEARDRLLPWLIEVNEAIDLYVIEVPPGLAEHELAGQLLATGQYDLIQPDWLVFPVAVQPDDPNFSQQWHLPRIQAPLAWELTTGSSSVTIAFVDTGVDLDHPDLASVLVSGYNSAWRLTQAQGGPVDDVHAGSHGTSVLATGVAAGNNGVGISGVGWDFRAMPVRATNLASGSAFLSDIIDGITWSVANGADVVSVSYAGVDSASNELIGEWVMDQGSLLVWAIGNGAIRRDFDHEHVLVVSGTDQADELYSNSNYGPGVDLAAPAVQIKSANRNGGYGTYGGTSYAAPIVAGVAGLVWSINPGLEAEDVFDILTGSALDLGAPGVDEQFGAGLVDAHAALVSDEIDGDNSSGIQVNQPCTPRFLTTPPMASPQFEPEPGVWVREYRSLDIDSGLPDFSVLTPKNIIIQPLLLLEPDSIPGPGDRGDLPGRGFVLDGFISIDQPGLYRLSLISDGISQLSIGSLCVTRNEAFAGLVSESTGLVNFDQGLYPVHIEYLSPQGLSILTVSIASDTMPKQLVPDSITSLERHPADINRDGIVDSQDFFDYLDLFVDEDPLADLTGDGIIDASDFFEFLRLLAID